MYGIVVPLVDCSMLTYALCRRLSGNRPGRREAGLPAMIYLLMRLNVTFIYICTQLSRHLVLPLLTCKRPMCLVYEVTSSYIE